MKKLILILLGVFVFTTVTMAREEEPLNCEDYKEEISACPEGYTEVSPAVEEVRKWVGTNWSKWSEKSKKCTFGCEQETRTVVTQEAVEEISHIEYSYRHGVIIKGKWVGTNWSKWELTPSSCNPKTCQERTRTVVTQEAVEEESHTEYRYRYGFWKIVVKAKDAVCVKDEVEETEKPAEENTKETTYPAIPVTETPTLVNDVEENKTEETEAVKDGKRKTAPSKILGFRPYEFDTLKWNIRKSAKMVDITSYDKNGNVLWKLRTENDGVFRLRGLPGDHFKVRGMNPMGLGQWTKKVYRQ